MTKRREQKSKKNVRVFFSYAMEDSAYAAGLLNILRQHPNCQVFTTDKISAGGSWRAIIKKALSESSIFMVLLSPASVNSKWVQFELGAAWGLDKFIVPIVTTWDVIDKIPLEINSSQILHLDTVEIPSLINQLVEGHYEKKKNAA